MIISSLFFFLKLRSVSENSCGENQNAHFMTNNLFTKTFSETEVCCGVQAKETEVCCGVQAIDKCVVVYWQKRQKCAVVYRQ